MTGASMHRAMTDLLLRVARLGDGEAFRNLFDHYAPRIKAFMMRQGADAATAEELAQETLLVVWRKAALYSSDKGSAGTWIFTIARNLRIDRLRREFAWQELPRGHEEEASSDPTPDEQLLGAEAQVGIRSALSQLPADQLEVVQLSFIDGLSHSEIAERLALPVGTVKSRMRLAYQKLRSAVEELN